jgi:hypothetical protein
MRAAAANEQAGLAFSPYQIPVWDLSHSFHLPAAGDLIPAGNG